MARLLAAGCAEGGGGVLISQPFERGRVVPRGVARLRPARRAGLARRLQEDRGRPAAHLVHRGGVCQERHALWRRRRQRRTQAAGPARPTTQRPAAPGRARWGLVGRERLSEGGGGRDRAWQAGRSAAEAVADVSVTQRAVEARALLRRGVMRPTASRAERVAGVRSPVLGVEPEERWRGRGPSLRWRGLSVRDDDHARVTRALPGYAGAPTKRKLSERALLARLLGSNREVLYELDLHVE